MNGTGLSNRTSFRESSRDEQLSIVIPDGNLTVKRGPIHLRVQQILEEDGIERPVFRQQKW